MAPYTDPPIEISEVCQRLDSASSIEVLEVLRNVIHWSDHLTRKDRQLITDAILARYERICDDHG